MHCKLAVGLLLVACSSSAPHVDAPPPCAEHLPTPTTVDRAVLGESLALGATYLLANQKPAGNFTYEYDWTTKSFSPGDSPVRQAGAMWGLALIYHDAPSPEVAAAVDRAIEFFASNSKVTPAGERYIVYPGTREGRTGAIALATLALIDYVRADPPHLDAQQRDRLDTLLDEYIAQLVRSQRPEGGWHQGYAHDDGVPFGANNPYADGEAILAYVKAAKYLGREALRAPGVEAAEAGYRDNIVAALAEHPDSNITKGFYQWSSMAFYEIATSGWPDADVWPQRVIDLADWMIDVHQTLRRPRNTAYAYEGMILAWELARSAGDDDHVRSIGRVIEVGLSKLTSWQVGGPTQNPCIAATPTDDPFAIGGVQNHGKDPLLRIDVTQHQMHAVILARRYYFTD
jgi:UDP-N-acetylmuramoyl-tripeptide--D-alanyl-D-alanine ligase